MSAGGAFGGARGLQAKAPEKGVFRLDHFEECKKEQMEYMECLKEKKNMAEECTDLAKSYLMCRMDAGLMAKQSLQELGLDGIYKPEKVEIVQNDTRSSQGFVAGVRSSGQN
eukprot:jgi/Ulvmu1/12237/UM086_0028.1